MNSLRPVFTARRGFPALAAIASAMVCYLRAQRPSLKGWVIAAIALALTACGGGGGDSPSGYDKDASQSLIYAFPGDRQQQVPMPSPVILRFSSAITATTPENAVTVRDADDNPVNVTASLSPDRRSLILTPVEKFAPRTHYRVELADMALEKGTAPARTLSFDTRAREEGPRGEVAADTFSLLRRIPDGTQMPIMDFSSFRLQFSQPLDSDSIAYGDSVRLTDSEGALVDAVVLNHDHYLTVDPVEDLRPGQQYTLEVTAGVTSTLGQALSTEGLALRTRFVPRDTRPPGGGERAVMVQNVAADGALSPLTGAPVNLIPMTSVLLGRETATQASGLLHAELAFAPNFPYTTPLRIARGSLIDSAPIDVMIGGEVPAGFASGDVGVHFLSDATGYLSPNPYSNAVDAPRLVTLFMDVALTTSEARANGAVTQDLLHLELQGTAMVEDGVLVVHAVGVVQPKILGSERATGLLSFSLRSLPDQLNPPPANTDTSVATLQSWSHADTRVVNRDAPVVLTFSKPIDNRTLDSITLLGTRNGQTGPVEISARTDGSTVILQPATALESPTDDDEISYQVDLGNTLADIQGIPVAPATQPLAFAFPRLISDYQWLARYPIFGAEGSAEDNRIYPELVMDHAPVVLMVYPGFPCVIDESTQDLSAGIAGRCQGALNREYHNLIEAHNRFQTIAKHPDDLLPISTLPANASIHVQATRDLDPGTVLLGDTFLVEALDEQGAPTGQVAGTLEVTGANIRFTPDAPWQPGTLYRYSLVGNGDGRAVPRQQDDTPILPEPPLCDGSDGICDRDGRPLQTQLYEANAGLDSNGHDFIMTQATDSLLGGPTLRQVFRATEPSGNVLQLLSAASVDSNANFYHDINPAVDVPLEQVFSVAFLGMDLNHRRYQHEEQRLEGLPLDDSADVHDPDGIQPPPNSAKMLSLSPWIDPAEYTEQFYFNGLSIGCAYDMAVMTETGVPTTPLTCPERKFTFMHSGLAVEVTNNYVDGQGLEVLIWPSQIMSTALSVVTVLSNSLPIQIDSGYHVMRMRYAKADPQCDETLEPCLRNRPVSAWITSDQEGNPVLSATVDLYIDAPDLRRNTNFPQVGNLANNLISIPVTLHLEGPVHFDDTGRMVADQINTNPVTLTFDVETYDESSNVIAHAAQFDMLLPARGAFLQYISAPNK